VSRASQGDGKFLGKKKHRREEEEEEENDDEARESM